MKDKRELEQDIIKAIKTCYDPEIPVDIYELGLIYSIDIDDDRYVTVKMTLTTPACPVAISMPLFIENKVQTVPEVKDARVEVVWDPPWSQDMMSEAARFDLGLL
ncbi:MAG: SUF system Fe-S cluster assembly protein [Candidatus Cloacimonetes bacterium 4572_55]|nr:MAG: SUF system Fe-S cluster assembly protein [Candidatus Cloacimonetes bacterium 4572_55]